MGKLTDEPTQSERVQAARARLERLRKEQGVPEFNWDEVMALGWKSDEPREEFDRFLRELRQTGSRTP